MIEERSTWGSAEPFKSNGVICRASIAVVAPSVWLKIENLTASSVLFDVLTAADDLLVPEASYADIHPMFMKNTRGYLFLHRSRSESTLESISTIMTQGKRNYHDRIGHARIAIRRFQMQQTAPNRGF